MKIKISDILNRVQAVSTITELDELEQDYVGAIDFQDIICIDPAEEFISELLNEKEKYEEIKKKKQEKYIFLGKKLADIAGPLIKNDEEIEAILNDVRTGLIDRLYGLRSTSDKTSYKEVLAALVSIVGYVPDVSEISQIKQKLQEYDAATGELSKMRRTQSVYGR